MTEVFVEQPLASPGSSNYWTVQLDFKILLKEFGTDCLGLVYLYFCLQKNNTTYSQIHPILLLPTQPKSPLNPVMHFSLSHPMEGLERLRQWWTDAKCTNLRGFYIHSPSPLHNWSLLHTPSSRCFQTFFKKNLYDFFNYLTKFSKTNHTSTW